MGHRQQDSQQGRSASRRCTWSIPVPDAEVDAFGDVCRSLSVPFALGSAVKISSWREHHEVRTGRNFIFARREDLERVLERETAPTS